jgi:hypothetical protein
MLVITVSFATASHLFRGSLSVGIIKSEQEVSFGRLPRFTLNDGLICHCEEGLRGIVLNKTLKFEKKPCLF